MTNFISKISRFSAIVGGIVLTALAITMFISILGGTIAKAANSDWMMSAMPGFANWLQGTGIRTIPAMYELMEVGIAFVIFSFLPITTFYRAHAVVDIFTSFFPPKFNDFLIAFWETVFFIVLALITWRLYYGMDRMMSNGTNLVELGIPVWWGYAVAFVQMILASFTSLYVAYALWLKFFSGKELLPNIEGAVH